MTAKLKNGVKTLLLLILGTRARVCVDAWILVELQSSEGKGARQHHTGTERLSGCGGWGGVGLCDRKLRDPPHPLLCSQAALQFESCWDYRPAPTQLEMLLSGFLAWLIQWC